MSARIGITKADIRQATDDGSWGRGVDYFDEGRVESLIIDDGEITAKVRGRRPYKVTLEITAGYPEGDCNCPMGEGGYFCKHCVAVALAYLEDQGEALRTKKRKKGKKRKAAKVTIKDVKQYLGGRDKSELVDMLIEQVKQDDNLRERLFLLLASDHNGKVAMETFREAIDEATTADCYDYRYGGDRGYERSRDMGEVLGSLERLLEEGHGAEVMELAEYAIERCDASGDHADEYYVEKLVELFHEACKKVQPEAEEFAVKLFTMSIQSEWFCEAVEDYQDILGKKGMSIYRQLASEQWAKIPVLKAGDESDYGGTRSRITRIMETIAGMDNDIEMLVEIKSKSLTQPWDYLKIANIYKENKQRGKAIAWAEKATKAFSRKDGLRTVGEFLAEEYHHLKRHDEAMDIIWEEFTEHTGLAGYQNLKKHADRCGQWEQWRKKALEYIEAETGKGMRKSKRDRWSYSGFSDHSLLVQIYLWENSVEKAWREAQTGGCSTNLWLNLAEKRGGTHPDDSIEIYKSVVGPIVERTNDDAYREATGYIKAIRKLMSVQKKEKEFDTYLSEIRTAFKRKRNFIKMLAKL